MRARRRNRINRISGTKPIIGRARVRCFATRCLLDVAHACARVLCYHRNNEVQTAYTDRRGSPIIIRISYRIIIMGYCHVCVMRLRSFFFPHAAVHTSAVPPTGRRIVGEYRHLLLSCAQYRPPPRGKYRPRLRTQVHATPGIISFIFFRRTYDVSSVRYSFMFPEE